MPRFAWTSQSVLEFQPRARAHARMNGAASAVKNPRCSTRHFETSSKVCRQPHRRRQPLFRRVHAAEVRSGVGDRTCSVF